MNIGLSCSSPLCVCVFVFIETGFDSISEFNLIQFGCDFVHDFNALAGIHKSEMRQSWDDGNVQRIRVQKRVGERSEQQKSYKLQNEDNRANKVH